LCLKKNTRVSKKPESFEIKHKSQYKFRKKENLEKERKKPKNRKKMTKIKKLIEKIIKKKKIKRFRLQGKHLFLTYPKLILAREKVLEQLKRVLLPRIIENYVISTEKHSTGEDHVHVYLKLDNKCDISDRTKLDLVTEENEKKHGNYQTCRSYNKVINYVIKEDIKENVLTNMNLDEMGRELNV